MAGWSSAPHLDLAGLTSDAAARDRFTGAIAERGLESDLAGCAVETHVIGDCWSPRTAEEAVLEGLKIAIAL